MQALTRLFLRALLDVERKPAKAETGPDTALIVASYNAARTEIIERMKLREGIIVSFVTASVTIGGAVIVFKGIAPLDVIKLYFVTPALSLIVAVAIRQHNETIENLAQFLRTNLGPYFSHDGLALQWDGYTRQTPVEQSKTSWRLRYHLMALHGPCSVSLVIGWSALARGFHDRGSGHAYPYWLTCAIAVAASAAWIVAAAMTFQSFKVRGVKLQPLGWLVGMIGLIVLCVVGLAMLPSH